MDTNIVSELISTVGFPITCVIALAYFAFYMVKKSNDAAAANKGATLQLIQINDIQYPYSENFTVDLETCYKW